MRIERYITLVVSTPWAMSTITKLESEFRSALLGLAVGDALGVPVEFTSRATLQRDPVTGMLAFCTHHQPAGTWSDDASLTFCLAEALAAGYSVRGLAARCVRWVDEQFWTPHGRVFDIGTQPVRRCPNSRSKRQRPPRWLGGAMK